jgi:hypothetical protein
LWLGPLSKLLANELQIVLVELLLFLSVSVLAFSLDYGACFHVGLVTLLFLLILVYNEAFADLIE